MRGLFTRFTNDPLINNSAVFSHDGSRVVYQTNPNNGPLNLYAQPINGGRGEPLVTSERNLMASDWSRDGRYLLYRSTEAATGWDLFVASMIGTRESRPVVQTKGDDMDGQFSPDGRFIAYQSDDGSGDHEIYIQGFPEPGQRVRVSTQGGSQVRWRRDGKELYYIALDDSTDGRADRPFA